MTKTLPDQLRASFHREHLRRSACSTANREEAKSLMVEASKLLDATEVASGAQIRAAASLIRILRSNH